MDLFKSRLDEIETIIKGQIDGIHQRIILSEKSIQKGTEALEVTNDEKVVAKVNYNEIESLFGSHRYSFLEPKIGPHPDFKHIGHNQYMNHYAVSMFVDIKGSTYLSNKYNLLQIRQIKDTILTLAIEVCSFFGGHIHRIQGDGIFVYFVRTDMHPKDATINSLNAASLLCYFMQYKLPHYFTEEVNAPKIRVGIDYGDANGTLWSYYGLTYCNELTTTGLHTDLAAKLQAKAPSNGILVGNNIIQELDLHDNIIYLNPDDKFIFNNTYKKFEFKWEKYLLTFDFIKRDGKGGLILEKPIFSLKCQISKDGNVPFNIYHQNLFSIPKDYKIRFTLLKNGIEYRLNTYADEHLEWKIVNTGNQAKVDNKLSEDLKNCKDQIICDVVAQFLGQHEMQCKIIKKGALTNVNVKFSVFVQ